MQAEVIVPSTGKSVTGLVWPDSGADHCIFPLLVTSLLGLDPLNMKMHPTGGVGSQANLTYYEMVEIRMPVPNGTPLSFRTYAGFTQGADALGMGLLGQSGFFETFRVQFDHAAKVFHIEV